MATYGGGDGHPLTYLGRDGHLYRKEWPFIYLYKRGMATCLIEDGHLPTYLGGDGHFYTYIDGMVTYLII